MAYNPLAFGLMLIAMGSLLFSFYVYACRKKITNQQEKAYGGVFILLGIIAGVFAISMFISAPIPAHYIEVYGVGYFIFSILSIIAGLCMVNKWDKQPAAYLAAIGGVILLGTARTVYNFSMSKSPVVTTALFVLTGLGAMGTLSLTCTKKISKDWITLIALIFLVAGLLALYSGLSAQFSHVGSQLATLAAT